VAGTPLCAVIPALDEETTIAAVVAGAGRAAAEVIVVDNGSSDATAARAEATGARVVQEPRRGYGAACLAGALAAPPDAVLVFCDADGSGDPAALRRVAGPVLAEEAGLMLGSRLRGGAEPGALRAHQAAANRAVAALIRAAWGVQVTDVGPIRAIRRADLLALDMRSRTYGWPVEMLVKAARVGLPIGEVAVGARPRAAGRSKVSGSPAASLKAGVHFGGALLRYGIGPRP
jgi:glycosyltransferase involved in cell wall biosynthesis